MRKSLCVTINWGLVREPSIQQNFGVADTRDTELSNFRTKIYLVNCTYYFVTIYIHRCVPRSNCVVDISRFLESEENRRAL